MSQSINLGNVGEVNFNGSAVDEVRLNGSLIWEGVPANTLVTGMILSVRDDKIVTDQDVIGYGRWDNFGDSLSPILLGGFTVHYIEQSEHFYTPAQEVNWGQRPYNVALAISLAGAHAKNAFEYFSINGVKYYTALTGGSYRSDQISLQGATFGLDGYEVGQASQGTITTWEWNALRTEKPFPVAAGTYEVKLA